MLRVGLTGELGSGKSTVSRLLADHGALVMSSDEIGRELMQPGTTPYKAIVEQFGPGVVLPGGPLNRPELARLAFDPGHPRVEELNAILHPAVLAEQERRLVLIGHKEPGAIVVIESALIFTTRHGGSEHPWRARFDVVVLVTAPDEVKIARFVSRSVQGRDVSPTERQALEADGKARLARQRVPASAQVDFLIGNDQGLDALRLHVDQVWAELQELAASSH